MKKLDANELFQLTIKPTITQISLEALRQFHEKYLEPYIFIFELEDGRTVKLGFDKDKFCHLIGIQKLANNVVRRVDRYKYRGHEGYKNIENGTITLENLKSLANKRINFIKDKLIFFYLLPRIVEYPELLLNFESFSEESKIEVKLLIYNLTQEVCVHLGIDENNSTGVYYPKTFLCERITETNDGTKFIKGQTPLKVISFEKEPKESISSS